MITQKYNYLSLRRENTPQGRKYISPTNEKLASVTTILDATKSEESKQALNNWRNRVGHAKAHEITTEASGRGTRMHSWLEKFILNDKLEEPGTNPYSQQSHKMATNIISCGLSNCSEYYGTEIGLFFQNIYAGTTDLIGIHNNDESIIDFKQSNKLKKIEWIQDYFLQLTAYGEAHNEMFGSKITKGVIMMSTADLNYQEFIIEGLEYDKYKDLWWRRVESYYLKHG